MSTRLQTFYGGLRSTMPEPQRSRDLARAATPASQFPDRRLLAWDVTCRAMLGGSARYPTRPSVSARRAAETTATVCELRVGCASRRSDGFWWVGHPRSWCAGRRSRTRPGGPSRRVTFAGATTLRRGPRRTAGRTARASCEAATPRATPLPVLIGGFAPELSRTTRRARGRAGRGSEISTPTTRMPLTRHRASVAGKRFVADGADGMAR